MENSSYIRTSAVGLVLMVMMLWPLQALGQSFVWPVNGRSVTQYYAEFDEVGNGEYHAGIDMVSTTGDLTIKAVDSGVARTILNGTYYNDNHGMGNVIIIDHGNRLFSLYAHLDEITVSNGESVNAGQQIGVMGNTGAEDAGIHLHFELKLWSVLGNLDDDLGPQWGYTPSYPNLWGYLNPYSYLEYDNIQHTDPKSVRILGDQIVRTGPDESYGDEVTNVEDNQRFVSFAERNGWHQIYLASEHGLATGWVEVSETGNNLMRIDDPARGTVGVSVRASPTTASSQTSHVWDTQWFVHFDVASSGDGCQENWYEIPLASNASGEFGWVCGEFVEPSDDGGDGPDIATTPSSFSMELEEGGSTTRMLTIQNNGDSDLNWNISIGEEGSSALRSMAAQNELDQRLARELDELRLRARREGKVSIIVGFDLEYQPEGHLRRLRGPDAVRLQRQQIANKQETLLQELAAYDVRSVRRFKYIPFMSMRVDAEGLQYLTAHPDVTSIREDREMSPDLSESTSLIGADEAWNQGYSGDGQTVAILDTGVDKYHPFLSGKVVSEACYSTADAPGEISLCPNGETVDTDPGAGLNCDSSIESCDHGTHVAGIAAGSGDDFSGVARDANVIAIQVFHKETTSAACDGNPPCIKSTTSDQILAMERVYELRNQFDIAAVNLSLGDGNKYTAPCNDAEPAREYKIILLRTAGIATVTASGNDNFTNGLQAPACISFAVSVGATTDEDDVRESSNSADFLDLLAPGESIESSMPGGFDEKSGTSMAAPHVTGAWAVLKQQAPEASVNQILAQLASTGVLIEDHGNETPRIQVDAALGIEGDFWLSANPVLGTVPSANSEQVTLEIDASSLSAGSYSASLTINSNDPDEGTLTVPLDLTVTDDGGGGGEGDGPDLVIEDPDVIPTEVGVGEEIELSYTIANQGNEDVDSHVDENEDSWEVAYYLSEDTNFSEEDEYLEATSFCVHECFVLPPRRGTEWEEDVEATETLPDDIPEGDYYVLIVADHDDVVDERNEDNNVEAVAITVTEGGGGDGPDLVVQNGTVTPEEVEAGGTITASATVDNIGGGSIVGENWHLGFYLSSDDVCTTGDTELESDSILGLVGLPIDREEELTIPAETPPGSYSICFIADHRDDVEESNESNNTDSVPITVQSATIAFSISRSFSNLSDRRSYRLVALPGADRVSVASTLEGETGEDWYVFWDNGAPGDYLVEHDGSARFDFAPGRGFWMLSRNTWSKSGETEAVTLAADGTYAIDLHEGWNIISNPFGKDVDWAAVQEANGLTQPLWSWNGDYDHAQIFASAQSGEAFYFINRSGLDKLTLPYPGAASSSSASSPDAGAPQARQQEQPSATLSLRAHAVGDTLSSMVQVGLAPEAKIGLDALDQFAPPGHFAPVRLSLKAPEGDLAAYPLAAEYRPAGQGQAFEVVLRAEPGAPVMLTAGGLDAFAGQEAVLVDRRTARRYDLRRQPALRVRPETETTRYALLVGPPAFVERAAAEIIPEQTELLGNYPNPFVGRTTIAYTMAEPAQVRLAVYDVLGRRVAVLVDERQEAGRKEIPFEARGLASGLYVYRLRVGDYVETGKLVIVR